MGQQRTDSTDKSRVSSHRHHQSERHPNDSPASLTIVPESVLPPIFTSHLTIAPHTIVIRLPDGRVREPLKPLSFKHGDEEGVPAWLLQPQSSTLLEIFTKWLLILLYFCTCGQGNQPLKKPCCRKTRCTLKIESMRFYCIFLDSTSQ